jgi:hypothetical protein
MTLGNDGRTVNAAAGGGKDWLQPCHQKWLGDGLWPLRFPVAITEWAATTMGVQGAR